MGKAEKTKQLIIEKSALLFNKKGIAGTSLSDILEVTKLAKGSLYVHFENKEAISHAVVEYYIDKQLKLMDAALAGSGSVKKRLFDYFEVFLNPEIPPFEGGCPFLNLGMEVDDTNDVSRRKIKKTIDTIHKKIRTTIQEGIDSEEFSNEWNAEEFAIKAYAMIEGAIMMKKITGSAKQMKTIEKLLKMEVEENLL
ncbi:transcriptional regulator, TetR family [Chryseobacterium wanjuense]|jgi:AcrR family transcriptional regulator|uniref:Transcriptional regulator, TetR family n=1 Tax=Chryseobacterium wanjuense TaxID=356305 RepID=A0A1I0PMR2_9FLAO|nr:TetR/AcrR family transcriptional regulator [Chryseobacterium wanjuense]SEW15633.1 transcriptional regulator, TetR family [Chryseobacterium wanjuense]